MNLKIKDICALLNVSEKTVYRWIKQEKIPYYRINHQYRFHRAEINEWIISNNMQVSEKILDIKMTDKDVSIVNLIENGGIYYHIEGDNIANILSNALKIIKLPDDCNREEVLELLLERESMMPTTVGKGIAFPHPRNPIIQDSTQESISIIFLNNIMKYPSIDEIPLHTIFLIFSSNAKRHLEILSKLSFACQDNDFITLLENRSVRNEYIEYLKQKEKQWQEKMGKDCD